MRNPKTYNDGIEAAAKDIMKIDGLIPHEFERQWCADYIRKLKRRSDTRKPKSNESTD